MTPPKGDVAHRNWRRLALAVAVIVVLTGCQAGPRDAPATPTAPPVSASPSGFQNPVHEGNFADPMIAKGSRGYLAVATNGNGSNVQTMTSGDLVSWEPGQDALPQLPNWSSPGKVWAPEIIRRADGRSLLYYTTRGPDPEIECISVAVAKQPEGPYLDSSKRPLVCDSSLGGSIDASPLVAADGARYLYWKNDGNAIGVDTYLWGQRLDSTGTKLLGAAKRLLKQDLTWEGSLVEAPFSWEQDGRFHLFYSANAFDSDRYAVGVATAADPLGPFTKRGDPVLTSNEVAAGPGHCALVKKDGKIWMAYHAWSPDAIGSEIPGRELWLSEVTFASNGDVSVAPPTAEYATRP